MLPSGAGAAGGGAGGRGEGHRNLDVVVVADLYFIDEAEVIDVDGDLGVVDGAELGFDLVAEGGLGGGINRGRWGVCFAHECTCLL